MNKQELDGYYKTRNGEIERITVNVKGYYSSGETYHEKWVYNFVDLAKQIVGEFYKEEELKSRFSYEFDNLNQRVKSTNESKHPLLGWQKEIFVFEYLNGNKIVEKHFDFNNNLIRTVQYDYDSLNNPTRILFNNSSGKLFSYETADYDYVNSKYLYKVYNRNGNLALQENNFFNIDTIGNLKNDYGDIIKLRWPTSSPANKVFHILEYEYDDKGNWVKRKRYIVASNKKKITSILKRQIQYREKK